MTIASRSTIEAKARESAERYTNVNDACPYPFGTEAGQLFKKMFMQALEEKRVLAPVNAAQAATQGIATP